MADVTVGNVLVPHNNLAKTPTDILVSYGGIAKYAIKCYASKNGVAKLVYPRSGENTFNHIDFKITNIGGATTARVAQKWLDPIKVTNLRSGETYTLEGGSATDNVAEFTNIMIGDIIRVEENEADAFRSWDAISLPIIALVVGENKDLSGTISCTHMPSMDKFTVDEAGTILGDGAFYGWNGSNYNYGGSVTDYPDGSFITDNITEVEGEAHFAEFNCRGNMTKHPVKAFCFPNLQTVGDNFMEEFNADGGALTYIANDAFDTRSIVNAGILYLNAFNGGATYGQPGIGAGKLTKVVSGSPLFINNVEALEVVYYNEDTNWTTIPKGANLRFNNNP